MAKREAELADAHAALEATQKEVVRLRVLVAESFYEGWGSGLPSYDFDPLDWENSDSKAALEELAT